MHSCTRRRVILTADKRMAVLSSNPLGGISCRPSWPNIVLAVDETVRNVDRMRRRSSDVAIWRSNNEIILTGTESSRDLHMDAVPAAGHWYPESGPHTGNGWRKVAGKVDLTGCISGGSKEAVIAHFTCWKHVFLNFNIRTIVHMSTKGCLPYPPDRTDLTDFLAVFWIFLFTDF